MLESTRLRKSAPCALGSGDAPGGAEEPGWIRFLRWNSQATKCTCSGQDVCSRFCATKTQKTVSPQCPGAGPTGAQGCRSASRVRPLWIDSVLSVHRRVLPTSHDVIAQKSTHLKVREGEGARSSICWPPPQILWCLGWAEGKPGAWSPVGLGLPCGWVSQAVVCCSPGAAAGSRIRSVDWDLNALQGGVQETQLVA